MKTCDQREKEGVGIFGSLWFRSVRRGAWTEYLLGAEPGGGAFRWAVDLRNFLKETGAVVVELDGFCDEDSVAGMKEAFAGVLGAGFPASYLVRGGNRAPLAGGLLVRAVAGVEVSPVEVEGRLLGFRFEDEDARWCYLGGLTAADASADGAGQTLEVMEMIRLALAGEGLNFRDVVRTWYYLDDILDWYGDFNRARNGFFTKHDVFSRMMPASTGIGIANSAGGKVLAKVHACRAGTGGLRVEDVASPLQCSAYEYGSAFSRAVRISSAVAETVLHVSGTASIAPGGETEHVGDLSSQIRLTMEVVGAILETAGSGWERVVRGIAYFPDAGELGRWESVRKEWGLPEQAVLAVHADVCRDDLWFELELETLGS